MVGAVIYSSSQGNNVTAYTVCGAAVLCSVVCVCNLFAFKIIILTACMLYIKVNSYNYVCSNQQLPTAH